MESRSEYSSDEEDEDQTLDHLIFVPTAGPSQRSESSPGVPEVTQRRRTAIVLDDDEDARVVVVDEKAGKEYGDGETMQESWRRFFAAKSKNGVGGSGKGHLLYVFHALINPDPDKTESSLWEPFDSEMDWRIASWCVKEGVSQSAMDRLLNIPKVSHYGQSQRPQA